MSDTLVKVFKIYLRILDEESISKDVDAYIGNWFEWGTSVWRNK